MPTDLRFNDGENRHLDVRAIDRRLASALYDAGIVHENYLPRWPPRSFHPILAPYLNAGCARRSCCDGFSIKPLLSKKGLNWAAGIKGVH